MLENVDSFYVGKNIEVFLQGFYGNVMNIYVESDVDVVILLKDCFQQDLKVLSEEQKIVWRVVYYDVVYVYWDFKKDVVLVLRDVYGGDVMVGDKVIVIVVCGVCCKVDVIVVIGYWCYYCFNGLCDQFYDEGICFYDVVGMWIVNYFK